MDEINPERDDGNAKNDDRKNGDDQPTANGVAGHDDAAKTVERLDYEGLAVARPNG